MDKFSSNSDSIAYKTRQSLIWYTTVPFAIHFLRFAASIVLARLLTPSDFGIIGIITVILYYCDSFSDFGFGSAIIQKKEINRSHYVSYFSFNLLVSIFFFLSVQFFSTNISLFYEIPELSKAIQIFAFLFLITAVSAGARVKLSRDLHFKSLAIINALTVVLLVSVSLTLAFYDFGFWSIILATLLARCFEMAMLLYVARYLPRFSFNMNPLKELFHFGFWAFIGAQIKLIADSVDKLIVGKVLGASSLGFYDKAVELARMPSDQISLKLSHISFTSFSRVQDDPEELENYFFKIIILNGTILLPILLGLFWVADTFTIVLLGDKWIPMIPGLQIFAVSFIFASFSNPIIAMNQAVSLVKHQSLIRIVLTIALIIGLIQVSSYGIEAVALAVLIFNVFMFLFSYALLNRNLKFGWEKLVLNLFPSIALVLIMLLFLYVLELILSPTHTFLNLVIMVAIGGISYTASFMLLPFDRMGFLRTRVLKKLKLVVST